jgi:hypothetical protein
MRGRISLAFLAACLAADLAASPARATDCSGLLSPCVNDEAFWPHAGAGTFVSVGSTETVAPSQIAFGLVTTYLNRPIVLGVRSPGGSGSDQYAVDDQVNGTFLWAYGVSKRLELDLAVPLTFGQGGTGLAPITGGNGLKDTAVRDLRFGFAYALIPHAHADDAPAGRRDGWGLAARVEVSAPTGDSDQFAGERSGVFVPSVAADWRHGRFVAGAELGARVRPTTELLGARVGTQLVTALGAGYDVLARRDLLTVLLEAWALPTLAEQHDVRLQPDNTYLSTPNGKYIAPAEWQLSARTAPLRGGDLAIQAGGGTEIPFTSPSGITTPRFRFTLGIRWAPLVHAAPVTPTTAPAASAVDLHLSTARDVCISDPDLVDGFKDDDGCPDEDQDKDGIPDRLDRCPLVPEDFAGLTDGCPEKR